MKGRDKMSIFDKLQAEGFEQVLFSYDEESGLKAITAIHDTSLGPALGGIRYWAYENEEEALTDALRLAMGMTYKNAAAGMPLGGAKTVFIKDPNRELDEEAMFRTFGRFVEGMNGRYILSVDVGTTTHHLDYIFQETDYVVGSNQKSGASGNPSPSTAHGVYTGMKAGANRVWGTDSLEGRTILLQGAGNVGLTVAEKALAEGARVIATDLYENLKDKAREMGCEVVEPDELLHQKGDIYTPCALGGTVNDDTIELLKKAGVQMIAGAANNQLAESRHGERLKEEDILYVPDYIINSGGVIHVADEMNGGFQPERARQSVEKIYNQVEKIFELADAEDLPMNLAADRFAEQRIESIRKTKRFFSKDNRSILDFI